MRTRIALVAITSIAVITVSALSQLVSVQQARAAIEAPHRSATPVHRVDRLTSLVRPSPAVVPPGTSGTLLVTPALDAFMLTGRPAPAPVAAPVAVPAPADTVTPGQRAAWERVALCEEGGNWHSDGPRFSGGLGITRANWAGFGGLQYASEGALATPDQQIMVAERIQSSAPDQYGCHGW